MACEPVFTRHGPSAFSSRPFRQAVNALGRPLVLIGPSLADGVLATAFAAADRGVPILIVRDSLDLAPFDEAAMLRALETSPETLILDHQQLFAEEAPALAAANSP